VADTLAEHSQATRNELQSALTVLADYEPSLRQPDAAVLGTLPPALARARVLQSLATVLGAVSRERPLLLILDDIQWADDLTFAFLSRDHGLTPASAKLCLVAAYRSDELSKERQQQLAEKASGAVLLERLSEPEVATLAGNLLGSQLVPGQVSELLHRHSDGNPFLVVQYLYSLLHQGVLRQSDDGSRTLVSNPLDAPRPVPGGLKELFEVRLGGLSEPARRALELGAVLGTEFRAELLEQSVARAGEGLDASFALWELTEHRLLEVLPGGRYRFVHDKLREAQLAALGPEARRALHGMAAELLSADPQGVETAELGLHFAEAGLPARAVPHLELAADQAGRRYANAEAVALYRVAIEQVRALDSVPSDERLALILRLAEARGDILFRSGRNDEAIAQFAAALEAAPAAARARIKRKQGAAAWSAHDYAAASAALEEAEQALSNADEPESARAHQWLEIQQNRFWTHYFAREAGPLTEAVLERMRPVVEQHGTALQRSMFFECRACHVMARDRYAFSEEVVSSARRALDELRREADHAGQAGSARFVLALSLVIGKIEHCREAVALLDENIRELEPIGDANLLSRSLVYQSLAYRRLADAERARSTNERARRYAERAQLTPYVGAALACEAWLCWRAENLEDAERLSTEAASWWRRGGHVFPFRWLGSLVALDIHRVRDDFDAAKLALDDLLEPTQMRFAKPLATALIAARAACTTLEPRAASRTLAALVQRLHGDGYL
jgi:tetratricopeptide (TPR) repeat protein